MDKTEGQFQIDISFINTRTLLKVCILIYMYIYFIEPEDKISLTEITYSFYVLMLSSLDLQSDNKLLPIYNY